MAPKSGSLTYMQYESAEQWRDAAMQRENGVDAAESERRREVVVSHHEQEGTTPSPDRLADYELYILGKMELSEYQEYLVFKYSNQE